MSKDKVDKSLGARKIEKYLKDETKKGKKMSEIFREAREEKKKPTKKPRSGGAPILDIKSITGRPDPKKRNYMAGGMVNPSYGTEFDDR